jgi:hypothetical protein
MSHTEHPSSSPQGSPRGSISVPSPELQLAQLQQQMAAMYAQVQAQQQQLQVAAAAASSSSSSASRAPELPKIRLPSQFSGSMGFAVDDWLGELQQQFAYYGTKFPTDDAKIKFAVAYFSGAAMHWWEFQPQASITTWSEFVSRLHGRFRPVHAAMLARQKLGKLRQRTGQVVNQYVGVFQNTLTPIRDMGDMDQVHHFVNGLSPALAGKVWEKHPENLIQAIDAAVSVEAMHNFGRAALPFGQRNGGSASAPSSNPDAMDVNNLEFDAEEQRDTPTVPQPIATEFAKLTASINALISSSSSRGGYGKGNDRRDRSKGTGDRIAGLDAAMIKKLRAENKCFRCKKEGHMKNECPTLNA